MKQTAMALKSFFSQFGVPAYSETSVPDELELPYITYPIKEPEWREKTSLYCIIWCRTSGYSQALSIADAIMGAVNEGAKIKTENGYVVLYPENPFFQEMTGESGSQTDNDTKGLYINMTMNSYHVAGV